MSGLPYFSFYSSRRLALCILLGHGVALGALVFSPIPPAAFLSLLVVLVLSSVYYVMRDARLTLAEAWIGLRLEEDCMVLVRRNGDEMAGQLLRSSVVTPQLVILNVKIPNYYWTQHVVLMSDSMEAESFRQLRVALKWGSGSHL
jgi:toxin CptA